MKLYATTTSERASKGQGGNEYLEIEISGENMQSLWFIKITKEKIEVKNPLNGKIQFEDIHWTEIKGNKQLPTTDCNENCKIVKGVCVGTKGNKQQKAKCTHDLDNYGKCCNCGKWITQ
jgi:hypothetical protein